MFEDLKTPEEKSQLTNLDNTPIPESNIAYNLPSQNNTEADGLKKVRDILFGSQIKEVDTKFYDLEKKVNVELKNFLTESKNFFASLENHFKNEFSNLKKEVTEFVKNEFEIFSNQLDSEKKDRYQSMEKFSNKIEKINDFEKNILDVKEKIDNIENKLQESIVDQAKIIEDELRQKFDDLFEELISKNQLIMQSKADRSELKALFHEMAAKIDESL